MTAPDLPSIAQTLAELRREHRALDTLVAEMVAAGSRDELQITRMKKRKLLLKDAIARLESKQIPDLDA